MALRLDATTRLLFVGDSITATGCYRDPEGLGFGFVRLIHDALKARDPAAAPTVINRGVDGNWIADLQVRWDHDVIAASPDIVSICIGVNDLTYRVLRPEAGVDIGLFLTGYTDILQRTRRALPNTAIVLCEPALISAPGMPDAHRQLRPYAEIVQRLALRFRAAAVVGFYPVLVDAQARRPDIDWAPDGIHPTPAGHAVLAQTWLADTGLGPAAA